MTLRDLSPVVKEVRDSPRSRWPLEAAQVGRRLEAELADPSVFGEVCEWIARIAKDHGCDRLLAASSFGERLAGGAVASADNGLGIVTEDATESSVLIVDGSLATGAQVLRASQAARAAGAKRVSAAVVVSLPRDPAADLEGEIDELFVLGRD